MASRRGYSAFIIAASLLMLSGLSVLYLETDGSDGINEGFTWERNGDDVTVTGHGTLGYDSSWNGLKTLTLVPEGGTIDIESHAFEDCGSLTTVTVNGSVGSIEDHVFSFSDSLTSVTFNGSVGSIGFCAFEDCNSLTTVTFNGPVGSIGDYVFHSCGSLTTVTTDGSVGSIGNYVFLSCGSLTTVTINGPIDSIVENAFGNCNSLTTVTIDGSVGSIGENAFINCGNLSELTVTGAITPPVPDTAFSSCINLKTVTVSCVKDIEAGSSDYGGIAEHATTVNKLHSYSSSYEWADDGSSCTVHIVCANTSDHDHDVTDATITSTVKVPPTETEKGTTEYTVSGTYDGYAFSDTKDIQDIPATGGGSDNKGINILIYVAIAVIAVLAVAGGAFLFIRSRR